MRQATPKLRYVTPNETATHSLRNPWLKWLTKHRSAWYPLLMYAQKHYYTSDSDIHIAYIRITNHFFSLSSRDKILAFLEKFLVE